MCPSGGDDSPLSAACNVDDYDFYVFHETDSEYAVFSVTAIHSLKHRPVEHPLGISKVDVMFCEVDLPLAFIPLEKHS